MAIGIENLLENLDSHLKTISAPILAQDIMVDNQVIITPQTPIVIDLVMTNTIKNLVIGKIIHLLSL